MSIRFLGGILTPSVIASGEIVTLVDEAFGTNFGVMQTPGSDEPGVAWSRSTVATPTASTGPDGGSNPATRAVEGGNGFAFTEGSPSGSERTFTMETPEFDASVGLFTLTFDLHMRFGSEGGIAVGTFSIEGWNGSAWSQISASVTGSQQLTAATPYLPSTNFGTYDSTGFTNTDFKFRFRMDTVDSTVNQDTAVDNIKVTGPESEIIVPPPAANVRAAGFNTGLRRLHVSADGIAPLDGTSPAQSFTTIQAGVNALQPGDVLTVGAGIYFETIQRSNLPGSVGNPVWIAAEEPYTAIVSNLNPQARDGSASWRDDGGGVFSTPGAPAFAAWFNDDVFLPQWELADLNDNDFTVGASASETATTLSKASVNRGFAFSGGRIHVRLPGGINPSGENVNVTNNFAAALFNFANADNVTVDGFVLEGAGDGSAITFDEACANPTAKNCKILGSQFGVRCANNTIIEDCEFLLPGHAQFGTDLRSDNPGNLNALFRYHKNYNNAARFKPGSNNSSDALMEGGLEINRFGGTPPTGIISRRNYMHEVFEGSKAGRMRSIVCSENVYDECGDDAIECEANEANGLSNGRLEVHDCLIKNCFGSISHQGTILGEQFIYRNVIVIDDPEVAGFPAFIAKTIKTEASAVIQWYHNTIINRVAASDSSPGFGTNHWVWFGFGASEADAIKNFISNIVVMPNDLDDSAVNPVNIENNVVVSPADNGQSGDVQGTGGTFVASEAALDLAADFSLNVGSPAIGAGRGSLPAGFPDSRSTGTPFADAGAFPADFTVPANWPREQATIFDDALPPRWTSPGA